MSDTFCLLDVSCTYFIHCFSTLYLLTWPTGEYLVLFMTTFYSLFHYFGVFIPPISNFLCCVHLFTHVKICIIISLLLKMKLIRLLLLLWVLSSREWKWKCKPSHKGTGLSSSSICFSRFQQTAEHLICMANQSIRGDREHERWSVDKSSLLSTLKHKNVYVHNII